MFRLDPLIDLGNKQFAQAQVVLKHLSPLLTDNRKKLIDNVVKNRCFNTLPVLENIYDNGNISAVLRSAEAMGYGQALIIPPAGEKFKESQRTTAGADKWVEIKKIATSTEAITWLKSQNYQIVATTLSETSKTPDQIDLTLPTALVFGNEKEGVSPIILEHADHHLAIPMNGFVQSYNISVAAALLLWIVKEQKKLKNISHSDLTFEQQETLKAYYYLRTQDSGYDLLKHINQKGLL